MMQVMDMNLLIQKKAVPYPQWALYKAPNPTEIYLYCMSKMFFWEDAAVPDGDRRGLGGDECLCACHLSDHD